MSVYVRDLMGNRGGRATQSKLRRATPQDTMLKDLLGASTRADKVKIVEQFNPLHYLLYKEGSCYETHTLQEQD